MPTNVLAEVSSQQRKNYTRSGYILAVVSGLPRRTRRATQGRDEFERPEREHPGSPKSRVVDNELAIMDDLIILKPQDTDNE